MGFDFEDVCKSIKTGSMLNKELALLLHERSDLELSYFKSLSKLSSKMLKVINSHNFTYKSLRHSFSESQLNNDADSVRSKINILGIRKSYRKQKEEPSMSSEKASIFSAWEVICTQIEKEAQIHKNFGSILEEDLVKPMTQISKSQSEKRKNIENEFEKIDKLYDEARSEEIRNKISSFDNQRQAQRYKDMVETLTNKLPCTPNNPNLEKDFARSEEKLTKSRDSCRRADNLYHETCLISERLRQEREYTLATSLQKLQNLEDEHLAVSIDLMSKYLASMTNLPDSLSKIISNVSEAVIRLNQQTHEINPNLFLCNHRRNSGQTSNEIESESLEQNIKNEDMFALLENCNTHLPQQFLFDFYAEDYSNGMNRDTRQKILEKYLVMIRQDLEKQRTARESIDNLIKVHSLKLGTDSDHSSVEESLKDEIRQKLLSCHHSFNHLQATSYKLSAAIADLSKKPLPYDPRAKYIETTSDNKEGILTSTLTIPAYDPDIGLKHFQTEYNDLVSTLTRQDDNRGKRRNSQNTSAIPSTKSNHNNVIINMNSNFLKDSNNKPGRHNKVEVDKVAMKGCGLSFTNVGKSLFGASRTAKSHHSRGKSETAKGAIVNNPATSHHLGKRNDGNEELGPDAKSVVQMRRDSQSDPNILGDHFEGPTRYQPSNKYTSNIYPPLAPNNNNDKNNDKVPIKQRPITIMIPEGHPSDRNDTNYSNFQDYKNNNNNRIYRRHSSKKYPNDSSNNDNFKEHRHSNDNNNNINRAHGNGHLYLSSKGRNHAGSTKLCIVKYEYKASRSDELSIKPGDIIEILGKQQDGWWKGQRVVPWGTAIGIFPSTYVQELPSKEVANIPHIT